MGERKKKKTLKFLGYLLEVVLPSSMEKVKPASKVGQLRSVSEVDAKGRFPFFHCASDGIPKTFAVFFFFLSTAFTVRRGF